MEQWEPVFVQLAEKVMRLEKRVEALCNAQIHTASGLTSVMQVLAKEYPGKSMDLQDIKDDLDDL